MTENPPPIRSRLTRLAIRNFKRFESVEIELGSPVVFVGPNDSGKTTALQALALWHLGARRWMEARARGNARHAQIGATVGRRDLHSAPVPRAEELWRDLRVTDGRTYAHHRRDLLIQVTVTGRSSRGEWTCGLEFEYANEESFYCRPFREPDDPPISSIPDEAAAVSLAYLPSMSGLMLDEVRLEPGTVNARLGAGRTAEVLGNLCLRLYEERPEEWDRVVARVAGTFGVQVDPPLYVPENGEIELTYRQRGVRLNIAASGRGCRQTLLLLTFLSLNPGAVLLLDEPDAHLETLRQRQVYESLSDAASETGGQIIAATHSEVILKEAADRDTVIAFVGKPHRIGRNRDGLRRALGEIEFHDYALAERVGWVLYIEGSTDLAVLQAFARRLGHDGAQRALETPFLRYVGGEPKAAQRHFHGLREATPTLCGIALFDRLPRPLPFDEHLRLLAWKRNEIENYFCTEKCLLAFAEAQPRADAPDLFAPQRVETMRGAIGRIRAGSEMFDRPAIWSSDAKASTDVLEPILANYFKILGIYNDMPKKNLHRLVAHLPDDEIPDEVREKLDAIAEVFTVATKSRER